MSFKDGKLNISPTYLENNMLNLNLKGTQIFQILLITI